MTDKKQVGAVRRNYSGHILGTIRENWNTISSVSSVRMIASRAFGSAELGA